MIKLKTLFLLIFFFPIFLFGQVESEYHFLTPLEKQIKSTPLDTLADAIILLDKGIFITYPDYSYELIKHKRIKILTQKGLDEAEVTIPFYA